ncbi:MAG: hypothetical protein AAFX94_02095 [Myxococcota bacterium]
MFEVNSAMERWFEAEGASLSRLGLDVSPVGPERWALSAIPAALGEVSPAAVVLALRGLVGTSAIASLLRGFAALAGPPAESEERDRWVMEAVAAGPDNETVYSCPVDGLAQRLKPRLK